MILIYNTTDLHKYVNNIYNYIYRVDSLKNILKKRKTYKKEKNVTNDHHFFLFFKRTVSDYLYLGGV